jgi:hypothetical protein
MQPKACDPVGGPASVLDAESPRAPDVVSTAAGTATYRLSVNDGWRSGGTLGDSGGNLAMPLSRCRTAAPFNGYGPRFCQA